MDDYIKREYAERLICSECCIGFCQKNMCRIINRLNEEIPAADVVEVVRCRDCKHFFDDGVRFEEGGGVVFMRCELCHEDARDEFFCADGERRSGDG